MLSQRVRFLDSHLPPELFPMKGILWRQESTAHHFFQLTGKRVQLEDSEWPWPSGAQLVCIGRKLDIKTVEEKLMNCVAEG